MWTNSSDSTKLSGTTGLDDSNHFPKVDQINSVVLSYFNTLLRQSDVSLLRKPNWLNDNLISFYFEYLENDRFKKHVNLIEFVSPQVAQFIKSATWLDSHTRQDVREILNNDNFLSKELILLPINDCNRNESGGAHWALMAIHMNEHLFELYDSAIGTPMHHVAATLFEFLKPILMTNPDEARLENAQCITQQNHFDCGIHVLTNAIEVCIRKFEQPNLQICSISNKEYCSTFREVMFELIEKLRIQERSIESIRLS